jgi:hypothetical protein
VSFTILGNQVSDVLQGAQITLTQLFETHPGSGQGAAASGVMIGITAATTPGAGSGTPVAPTSSGIVGLSESLYQYQWNVAASQATGDYLATWSGTVNGQQETYVQTVTVAAVPSGAPAPGVYATVAQYQAWSGDSFTPSQIVQVKLQRASEDIDNALIGAVYATNANGMPTDPMLIDVLARATCAQVQWLLAENDDAGIKRQYSSTSMGGVSQARVAAMTANPLPPLSPRAAQILHVAGVLQSAALINW